jgi:HAD superfamily hydrolase (TIGR01509 family)
MGWIEPDESCARAAEIDDRAFAAEVFARRKLDGANVEGWVARKQELTLKLLADSPRIYPGVAELIDRLAGRIRLGVVTTTWRGNVEAVLGASGLANAFEFVVAKEDVKATKPHPEAFRLALKKLRLPGDDVVSLEDSATGLAAARGAGVRTVAVGHRRPKGDWVGDSDYVAGFVDLARVLAAVGIPDEAPSRTP